MDRMRFEVLADKRRKGEIRKWLPSVRAEESAEIFRKALADYSAGKSPSDRPQGTSGRYGHRSS
jgi:hypothetical protein